MIVPYDYKINITLVRGSVQQEALTLWVRAARFCHLKESSCIYFHRMKMCVLHSGNKIK